jgi:hypothetical protein
MGGIRRQRGGEKGLTQNLSAPIIPPARLSVTEPRKTATVWLDKLDGTIVEHELQGTLRTIPRRGSECAFFVMGQLITQLGNLEQDWKSRIRGRFFDGLDHRVGHFRPPKTIAEVARHLILLVLKRFGPRRQAQRVADPMIEARSV